MTTQNGRSHDPERRPLLDHHDQSWRQSQDGGSRDEQKIEFDKNDGENPRNWSLRWKAFQTFQIFIVAFVCPMTSSMFAPAIDYITENFHTSKQITLLNQAGFVCMLGIGPLFHAPMSETFGRRKIFLLNLACFTVLQIPIALAPNVASFVALRTLSGFFGSVGVANGGGSISDMFETHRRARVLGIYLAAPLLGPAIGPLIGGLIVGSTQWRWICWTILVLSTLTTVMCYFFLLESRATTILELRKAELERHDPDTSYLVEGVSNQPLSKKVASNASRAVRILFTQPIVLTMSFYQALVFSSMYSLYSQYSTIFSASPYNFNSSQIGLAYLGPAVGFIITACFTVFFIDRLYNYLSSKHNDDGRPEYRLPLANIGAVLLPISLFWFGWAIEKELPWQVPIAATLLFGASQVSIFNTVQTYYIDSYEANAASALAAGAFLRSMLGGIVPLFVSALFDHLGYGLGMSVFGILSVLLMPAPVLFYQYGRKLREKYPFKG